MYKHDFFWGGILLEIRVGHFWQEDRKKKGFACPKSVPTCNTAILLCVFLASAKKLAYVMFLRARYHSRVWSHSLETCAHVHTYCTVFLSDRYKKIGCMYCVSQRLLQKIRLIDVLTSHSRVYW